MVRAGTQTTVCLPVTWLSRTQMFGEQQALSFGFSSPLVGCFALTVVALATFGI
jgi:hypothetical protein